MAKAIFMLQARSRWAVSGTPIQNRLGDLTSLLTFLQVHPYGDAKQFEHDITLPWKAGETEEAVSRLQRLAGCLILRRPKEAIHLPPRRDLRCVVEFDHEERLLYDEVKYQTISMAHDALRDLGAPGSVAFVNVIQKINSLRMICDMGLYYHSRHEDIASQQHHPHLSHWDAIAQRTFDFECESRVIRCHSCSTAFDPTEEILGWNKSQVLPLFSECLRLICSDCVLKPHKGRNSRSCGHSPAHPFAPVSANIAELDDTTDLPALHEAEPMLQSLPAKVTSLIRRLKDQPTGTKR